MTFSQEWNVWSIRKDFPILQTHVHGKPLIYLDSAATMQKPRSVIDAMSKFYLEEYGTVHRAVYALASGATERYDAVRAKVQQFIKAEHLEEIVFTRGTTEGINLVARSLGKALLLKHSDEILISETEHHSNIVPWQMLCEERGCTLKVIPVNDRGEIVMEEYEKMLLGNVKLVSVAHIANATGVIHPIATMIQMAHGKGALFLVDAAQSVAHYPLDMQLWDADFLVFSGHKAFGPTGIGILYGKKELLNQMPPYQGGGDMVEEVTFAKTTFQPSPLRFEAGTPSIAEVMGLGAAIDYIKTLGIESIAAWEKQLLDYAIAKLREIPEVRIIGDAKEKSAIVSFVCEGLHPLDIGTLLDLRGIAVRTGHHCAQPTMKRFGVPSTVRASFAAYNTIEEVDVFIYALKEVILLLRPSLSY